MIEPHIHLRDLPYPLWDLWTHPDGRLFGLTRLHNHHVELVEVTPEGADPICALSGLPPLPAQVYGGFHWLRHPIEDAIWLIGSGPRGVYRVLVDLGAQTQGQVELLPQWSQVLSVQRDGQLVAMQRRCRKVAWAREPWGEGAHPGVVDYATSAAPPRFDVGERFVVDQRRQPPGAVAIEDLVSGERVARARPFRHRVSDVSLSTDGETAWVCSRRARELVAVDVPSGTVRRRLHLDLAVARVAPWGDGRHATLVLDCGVCQCALVVLDLDTEVGRTVARLEVPLHSIDLMGHRAVAQNYRGDFYAYDLEAACLAAPGAEVLPRGRPPLCGKVFALTGAFESPRRADLERALKASGAHVSGALGRHVDAVIASGEPTRKLARARRLGLTVLSPEALPRALGLALDGEANARLTALRSLLAEAPSTRVWAQVRANLEGWPFKSSAEVARDYLHTHTRDWPDPLRAAVDAWLYPPEPEPAGAEAGVAEGGVS